MGRIGRCNCRGWTRRTAKNKPEGEGPDKSSVNPAQAGIHYPENLDSRFRGSDGV